MLETILNGQESISDNKTLTSNTAIEPKKSGKAIRALGKFGSFIKWGLLLLHLGTSAAFYANNLAIKIAPPALQRKFQQAHGLHISGYRQDVEKLLTAKGLSEVIEREKAEMPFHVTNIQVSSYNYLRQSFSDQMMTLFLTPYSGLASPSTYEIMMKPDATSANLTHEIKHIKTFQVLTSHPELREKWESLARDSNGDSLYYASNEREEVVSRINLIHVLGEDKNSNHEKNMKLGFVTNYARRNFYEDVAELCERVEAYSSCSPETLDSFLNNLNPVIKKKIRLASEYGLLPKEFIAYADIIRLFYKAENLKTHETEGMKATKIFLDQSNSFIAETPQSIYSINVRNLRADIFIYVSSEVVQILIKDIQYMDNLNERWQNLQIARKNIRYMGNGQNLTLREEMKAYADENEKMNRVTTRMRMRVREVEQNFQKALRETDLALLSEYKDPMAYARALATLSYLYSSLGDDKRGAVVVKAIHLFGQRVNENDPFSTRRGVNDYLFNEGILSRN